MQTSRGRKFLDDQVFSSQRVTRTLFGSEPPIPPPLSVERFPSEVLEQPLPALVQALHTRLRQALVIGPIKAEDRL